MSDIVWDLTRRAIIEESIQGAAIQNCKDFTSTRYRSAWWLAEFLADAVRDVDHVVLGAYGIKADTREEAESQIIAKYGNQP